MEQIDLTPKNTPELEQALRDLEMINTECALCLESLVINDAFCTREDADRARELVNRRNAAYKRMINALHE